jgi:hypothetical protein
LWFRFRLALNWALTLSPLVFPSARQISAPCEFTRSSPDDPASVVNSQSNWPASLTEPSASIWYSISTGLVVLSDGSTSPVAARVVPASL